MNQDLDRLKKLRDQVVGIEMHLTLIQSDLLAVDRDIEFLADLALVLEENIEILKSDKIIAVAAEYKRSIQELKTVYENLQHYENMKIQLNRDFQKYTKLRDDTLFEFELLKKNVDGRKVILLFDPSKRKK